ncbi:unnamed protein product [Linum trigynum]|uniref:Uncharacterized protein n=1 Tax=Linum trigynum TaxID=586398 RepID=A0AAV2E0Y9_9ROSI
MDAKSGGAVLEEECGSQLLDGRTHEYSTSKYHNFCEEAIKYVEEGTKSIHVYKVAMNALQEAAKKIFAVKSGVPPGGQDQMPATGKSGSAAALQSVVSSSYYTTLAIEVQDHF